MQTVLEPAVITQRESSAPVSSKNYLKQSFTINPVAIRTKAHLDSCLETAMDTHEIKEPQTAPPRVAPKEPLFTRIGLKLQPLELYRNDGSNNFVYRDSTMMYNILDYNLDVDRDTGDNVKPSGYSFRSTCWQPKRHISLIRKYPFNPTEDQAVQYYCLLRVIGVLGVEEKHMDSVIDILIDDNSFTVFRHGLRSETDVISLWADVTTAYLKRVLSINASVKPLQQKHHRFSFLLFIERVKRCKHAVCEVQTARDLAFVLHGAKNVQNYTKEGKYQKYDGIVLRVKGSTVRVCPAHKSPVMLDVFCKAIQKYDLSLACEVGSVPKHTSAFKRRIASLFHTGQKQLPYPCMFSRVQNKANLVRITLCMQKLNKSDQKQQKGKSGE